MKTTVAFAAFLLFTLFQVFTSAGQCVIYPVSIETFNLPAKRPSFSAMSNLKISGILNLTIKSWSDEVRDYLT